MKVFVEEQRFNQWWLYVILSIPVLVFLLPYVFGRDITLNSDNETFIGISISLITVLIATVFILMIRLKTKIDENGIYYQFFPLHINEKFISWNEISQCHVRKYKPLTEYGGWGYRSGFGRGKGRALSIRGTNGIQLVYKEGRKLLIGTQNSELAKKVLETYNYKINKTEFVNKI